MKRKAIGAVLILLLSFVSILLAAGFSLCKGGNHSVENPRPALLKRIELNGNGSKATIAWVSESGSGKGFLLAHGNSSDRNSMVARAEYLVSMGYDVIIPDLNGHGETPGKWKTFGIQEALDIENAHLYLKNTRGNAWIGGIGTSLGGASILKAVENGIAFDGLILESVFSDIRVAARNRLELKFGSNFANLEPLLTLQLPLWTGSSRNQIRPSEWAKSVMCPALILAGQADSRAKPKESEEIYGNIHYRKKWIRIIPGAGHEDLFAFDSRGYKNEVENFLRSIE
jgi:uncharacterized protein